MSDKDVPVITAQYEGRVPCPVCDQATVPGELIGKRWGRWVHETCFQNMTGPQRWEFTQQLNSKKVK